ncbi:MAG: amidohydrolase family protein [Gemmatimonadetes bacterium]|nr:amidohydrolase family protein [Gemmatimonadota bacterium]
MRRRYRLAGPLAALLVARAPALLGQAGCPIVDAHQHANPAPPSFVSAPPARPCPNGVHPCALGPGRFRTSEALLEGTLAAMDRLHITHAVVSTGDTANLDRWVARAPGRFLAGVSWGPGRPLPAIADLRRRHAAGRLSILGEFGPQYGGLLPSDTSLAPYFALAEELDVPVLLHMTAVGGTSDAYTAASGRPLALEPVLKRHPGLRVYLENSGYPFADEMIALMAQYPGVYGDLSRISWYLPRPAFHDYVRRLVRAGYGDRLMFGTDQSWWPEVIAEAVQAVRSAAFLTPAEQCAILGGNARRFFRLAEPR